MKNKSAMAVKSINEVGQSAAGGIVKYRWTRRTHNACNHKYYLQTRVDM